MTAIGGRKKWVFITFRVLYCIFQYTNVTPILQSSQNAFFWYIAQAYIYHTSDKNGKMDVKWAILNMGFDGFSTLSICIYQYSNVIPILQNFQSADFWYIAQGYMYNTSDKRKPNGRNVGGVN